MKNKTILIVSLSVLVLSMVALAVIINTREEATDPVVPVGATISTTTPPLSFTWIYEEDASLNLDGNKQINVVLEVQYADGSVIKKPIVTVPGGCNNVDELDGDEVTSSTQAQCYYAGLGYKFKITKGEKSYEVKRKTFEEALPDQLPKNYEYEVVSEFPF